MSARPTQQADSGPSESGTVLIVDDDVSVREALDSLFRSVGLKTRTFASAIEFTASDVPATPCCLVLDVRLPGLSGLDFQTHLAKTAVPVPIVFMTGHGDIPMAVRAMKAGAVDFLTKPFRDQDMLDAVTEAMAQDRRRRENEKAIAASREQFETLTPRERDIMVLLAQGIRTSGVFPMCSSTVPRISGAARDSWCACGSAVRAAPDALDHWHLLPSSMRGRCEEPLARAKQRHRHRCVQFTAQCPERLGLRGRVDHEELVHQRLEIAARRQRSDLASEDR